MNRLSALLLHRPALAQVLVMLAAALAGVGVFQWDQNQSASKRLDSLKVEAGRSAAKILASTQNGELMGAIKLLGLIDTNIKQEARGGTEPERGAVFSTLGKVGRAIDAECLFVVGQNGQILSFWSRDESSSSGLDVSQRPYYRLAMEGMASIYPGVSLSRVNQRALYHAAPIFSEVAKASVGDGAVVACTSAGALDQLLESTAEEALLVSPLGVVYASKQLQRLGALALDPEVERLDKIRASRQFGNFFNSNSPRELDLPLQTGLAHLDGRRWAVAASPVAWADPNGDWQLILIDDLRRSAPLSAAWLKGSASAVLVLLLGYMSLYILRASKARQQATAQLREFAARQQANVRYRTELAQTALRLQNCDTIDELTEVFFREARELLEALQGALYVQAGDDDKADLVLAGSAASAQAPPQRLVQGQGLLGQCALERRQQIITTPADGYWTLRCAAGDIAPGALLLTPLLMHNTLIGVLELGLLQAPDEQTLQKADELTALLGNALEILRRRRPAPPSRPPTESTT